jgi:hypothetical protein
MAVIAAGCVGVAGCASPQPPQAAGPSTTKSPTTTSTAVSQAAPTTSTPTCIGLSNCAPPPPDAEGNPACYYADGWRANSPGGGIEVWYFHEPQNMSKPDRITVVVRKKDGTSDSQDANIDAGQQAHRFEFAAIDASAVQEVLLSTSGGRCFVIGGPT